MSSLNREVSQGVLRTFMGQIICPQSLAEINCTESMVNFRENGQRGTFGLLSTLGEKVSLSGGAVMRR